LVSKNTGFSSCLIRSYGCEQGAMSRLGFCVEVYYIVNWSSKRLSGFYIKLTLIVFVLNANKYLLICWKVGEKDVTKK